MVKKKYNESEIFKEKVNIVDILISLIDKYDLIHKNSELYKRQTALCLDYTYSVTFKPLYGIYKLVKEYDKYIFYSNSICQKYVSKGQYHTRNGLKKIELHINLPNNNEVVYNILNIFGYFGYYREDMLERLFYSEDKHDCMGQCYAIYREH